MKHNYCQFVGHIFAAQLFWRGNLSIIPSRPEKMVLLLDKSSSVSTRQMFDDLPSK